MTNSKSYADYKNTLSGIYKNTFTQIVKIINFSLISNEDKETALSKLLETFESAEKDNVKIEEIVGKDINKFVKEYVNTLFPFHKISALIIRLLTFTFTLFIINLFVSIFNNITGSSKHFFTNRYNEIPILIISIVACTISQITNLIEQSNLCKKNKLIHSNLKIILFLTDIVIMFVLIFVFKTLNITFNVNFLSSTYVFLSFLFTLFFILIAINIIKSKPSGISEKIILSIKKDYENKKAKKNWTKEQYIANKKKYFYYIIPPIFTIYIILMLIVLGLFTINIIKYGMASLLGIVLVTAVITLLAYILISINVKCMQITGMLIRGEIL